MQTGTMKGIRHWKNNSMPMPFIRMSSIARPVSKSLFPMPSKLGVFHLHFLLCPYVSGHFFLSSVIHMLAHSSCTPERLSSLSHLTASKARLKAHICCVLGVGERGKVMRMWKTFSMGSSSFLSVSLLHKRHLWSLVSPLPLAKVKGRNLLQTSEERDSHLPRYVTSLLVFLSCL